MSFVKFALQANCSECKSSNYPAVILNCSISRLAQIFTASFCFELLRFYFLNWFRFLMVRESTPCNVVLKSSLMIAVRASNQYLCATDEPQAQFNARSVIECVERCTTSDDVCSFTNFYVDSLQCEIFNTFPNSFDTNIANCRLYRVRSDLFVLYANINTELHLRCMWPACESHIWKQCMGDCSMQKRNLTDPEISNGESLWTVRSLVNQLWVV
jgi:hypothetical protein